MINLFPTYYAARGKVKPTDRASAITVLYLALTCVVMPTSIRAFAAPQEVVLYNFHNDGDAYPYGPLLQDSTGALYGTTSGIGSRKRSSHGRVFKLTAPVEGGGQWTETPLHIFEADPDGEFPRGGLVMDANGALYGSTSAGGTGNTGTVFQLTPPPPGQTLWTETVLSSQFQGPQGTPLLGNNGTLYVVDTLGVFTLTPPTNGQTAWVRNEIYVFPSGGASGASPESGVIADSKGNLYGTTTQGGPANAGTIFMLAPPKKNATSWTETVLYAFQGGTADGSTPTASLVFGKAGVLYGTTSVGGGANLGTVFSLAPPAAGQTTWTETVLHNFVGGPADGAIPYAALTKASGGKFYGTTWTGGSSGSGTDGYGTVFELIPPVVGQSNWTETIVYNFAGPPNDGDSPYANLITGSTNLLYGTTIGGGSIHGNDQPCNCGTVFQIKP